MSKPAKRFPSCWRTLTGLWLALSLGLASGCCTTRPPPPALTTTPMLSEPADPVELANYLLTSLLMQSPLRDFSRRHRILWETDKSSGYPIAVATSQDLLRRLLNEDHLALQPSADGAAWHLMLRPTGDLLTLELRDLATGKVAWSGEVRSVK